MELINYYNLTNVQHAMFVKFLQECHNEISQPAHVNMYSFDWETKNNTLPYILEKTDRFFKNGEYNVLFNNNIVIACSGIYQSLFCNDLVIAGTRTWIKKEYRNKLISREILLPKEKTFAISNKYKAIALCFNEYNKNIIDIFYRKRLGEHRTDRLPHHLFYNNINQIEFPVTIQSTKQYVIYETLDKSFSFDWETIRYH